MKFSFKENNPPLTWGFDLNHLVAHIGNSKCQSARLNSLSPRRNLNLQRKNAVYKQGVRDLLGLRGGYPFVRFAAVAISSQQLECDWLTPYLLSTIHSYSLLYFLLFCETHDLVWEIISVSEKRIKNCIVKIIDIFFKMTIVSYFP